MLENMDDSAIKIIAFIIMYLISLFVFIFTSMKRMGKVNTDEVIFASTTLVPICIVLTYAYKIVLFILIVGSLLTATIYSIIKLFMYISKLILSKKFNIIPTLILRKKDKEV